MQIFLLKFFAVLCLLGIEPVVFADASASRDDTEYRIALPALRERPDGQSYYAQDLVLYALRYFMVKALPVAEGGHLKIKRSAVWTPALEHFARMAALTNTDEVLAYVVKQLLRSDLYLQRRLERGHAIPLPPQSRELASSLGLLLGGDGLRVRDWSINARECMVWIRNPSNVKGRSRLLMRCRLPSNKRVSLALTLNTQAFDLEAADQNPEVLETEVIVAGGAEDGHFDFFAYDASGEMSKCSGFYTGTKTVVAPNPQTCLSCHYDARRRQFGHLPQSYRQRIKQDVPLVPKDFSVHEDCI